MTDALVIGAVVAVVLAVLAWVKLRPMILDRVPNGWSLGPTIDGKSYSVGTSLLRRDPPMFDIPLRGGHVNALLYKGLRLRATLTLRYRVTADPGVTFHPQENPEAVGQVSLMIQRKGDDYSAKDGKEYYRLYAPGAQDIAPGEHALTVNLSPEGWVNVWGPVRQPTQAQFDAVLANLQAVHVCFGGPGGRAHGVFASGKARLEVVELLGGTP